MKLSVVVVNYNVKAFLEQCLRTAFEALEGMDGEVFVVDNQSTDGSTEMVREKFPQVKLIANTENVGFSRANNQAIKESCGEYVLLLNPDTVVGEDVFHKVVDFLDAHPKAGGLGVKMIDGTGRFLPESKRGLPTPTVAFFKIMGLSRLFPHSKLFGRYHLGHLPENEIAPIEILSGACMFLRKEMLDQVGLLDESFFMYGEDIDLSYRITLGGYENWYFPDAPIIHYKGESTKKSSVNYVFVFYNAMVIFARKHFTRRGPQLFSFIIRGAIYLSAAAALVLRFLRQALLPIVDLTLLYVGMLLLEQWNLLDVLTAPERLSIAAVIWGIMALFGVYDLPLKTANILKGLLALFLTGLATGQWTGLGALEVFSILAMAASFITCVRVVLYVLDIRRTTASPVERARVLTIGSEEETKRALGLLWQTHYGLDREIIMDTGAVDGITGAAQIKEVIRKQRLDEVVFCAKDLSSKRIISMLEQLQNTGVTFKIAQPASEFIIGPSTTESLQDLLILPDHAVDSSSAKRRRRSMDLLLALFFLITLPVGIWFVEAKVGFIQNLFLVLRGKRTWVGYVARSTDRRIPRIRPGVLDPARADHRAGAPLTLRRMDLEYAKDYRVWKDLRRVVANFRSLGALVGTR